MNELRPRNLEDYKIDYSIFYTLMYRCKGERHENFGLASDSPIGAHLDAFNGTVDMYEAYDHSLSLQALQALQERNQ